ncbi:hypothetical protein J3458_002638 [Metarhizium acridum]|uniref:uncharacterized protein n=1 Tax=Metarhizium acridum TaxID=92637 RepID=UPI001C6AE3A1|nr:hypothetical protein J3458_002638 [Metarhizium acridum]
MDISPYAVKAESIDALSAFRIASFFSRLVSITRDDCDQAATKLTGSSVSPALVQGRASYTVATDVGHSPPGVIQLRSSALSIETVNLARKTYGDFVPGCELRDMLGHVYVYAMDLVQGVAFCRARHQLLAPVMKHCLLQTTQDFARFFASAWINRPRLKQTPNIASSLFTHYFHIIEKLSEALPFNQN